MASYRRHRPPNLASIAAQLPTAADGLTCELVVVLNGISARAAGVPSDARIIDLVVNRGVPIAWNHAGRNASGTTLVFANDDVSLGPRSLRLLHDALADNPDAGVVGPIGTQWNISEARHVAYLPTITLPVGAVRDCDVVSGFLFATPRTLWLQSGGFDESYTPCGFEEVDYCTTIRTSVGRRCLAVEGVQFEHEFGVSSRRGWRRVRWGGRSERIDSISQRNRAHFLGKWGCVSVDGE